MGIRIEAVAIRSDKVDRSDLPHVLTTKIPSVRAMTIRAQSFVNRTALLGARFVDRKRIGRRLNIQQPVLDSFDARKVDGDGRYAGAERGAFVSFFNRNIVSVPMQLHALAIPLKPDGRKLRNSND